MCFLVSYTLLSKYINGRYSRFELLIKADYFLITWIDYVECLTKMIFQRVYADPLLNLNNYTMGSKYRKKNKFVKLCALKGTVL